MKPKEVHRFDGRDCMVMQEKKPPPLKKAKIEAEFKRQVRTCKNKENWFIPYSYLTIAFCQVAASNRQHSVRILRQSFACTDTRTPCKAAKGFTKGVKAQQKTTRVSDREAKIVMISS